MSKTATNKNVKKGGKGENKVPESGLDYEFFGNERNYQAADTGVGQGVILDVARRVGIRSLFSLQAEEVE